MPITSRAYAGLDDLQKMKNLLIECKRASLTSGYHIGDLDWWVFYDTSGEALSARVRLWEDEAGRAVGWVFCTLRRCEFDLVIHPDLRGSRDEESMIVWAEGCVSEAALRQPTSVDGARQIRALAFADETQRVALLERRGYVGDDYIVTFAQPLNGDLPAPQLPEGFTFLPAMRLEYAENRASAHANSFNPSKMTPDYYRGFMQAPGYDPDLDTVVVAPDGRFASFVMGWLDPTNRVGTFEPVGTHREFQRRGLGRAALLEGMRRLQARDMTLATVGCHAHNPGNLAFYRSAGFEIASRLMCFTKEVR